MFYFVHRVVTINLCILKYSRYTTMLNSAMDMITIPKPHCIIFQRRNVWEFPLLETQFDWDELMKKSKPHPCVMVNANDPLYILYTSGTTGKSFLMHTKLTHSICLHESYTTSNKKIMRISIYGYVHTYVELKIRDLSDFRK